MNTRQSIALFVLAGGFAPIAFADDGGLYVGASIGTAEHAKHVALKPPEVPLMIGTSDARDTSWTATVGYRVNANIAFELGYVNLGDMQASVTDPSGASDAQARFTFTVEGVTAAMIGRFPIGNWTPYMRAGVLFSETDLEYAGTVSGTGFGDRIKDDSEDAFFGGGVTYNLARGWAVQLDFTHVMDAGDPGSGQADYSAATIGLLWDF